jgi:hypothetical protein
MNLKSEQLNSNYDLVLDTDQPLLKKEIKRIIEINLGQSLYYKTIERKEYLVYKNTQNKRIVLLVNNITFLGGNGQHPTFKKRIQLPKWYKNSTIKLRKLGYDVRFLGVYHYKDNLICADFNKETYINRKMNNSSAHIFVNDLFQTKNYEVFNKIDKNNNRISVFKLSNLKKYLDDKVLNNDLFFFFDKFNSSLNLDWISAPKAIKEQFKEGWAHWKQTEWQGWYLEFKINEFIFLSGQSNLVIYTGSTNKKFKDLDFDLFFPEENFMGDLKTSDINSKFTIANDQDNFLEAIDKYEKFWYVVYEHETLKDSDMNYSATLFRNTLISEIEKVKSKNLMSYSRKMKHSIKLKKMYIIELNKSNYKSILGEFRQGKQVNGAKRKTKFIINKNNIDNYLVYKHIFE